MKKLVSYIPVGLMEESFNVELIESMKTSGVDIVELGLPFSDPVADGGVIQEANMKSLSQGYKIRSSFELASKLDLLGIDFVFMGYFNTFYRVGIENFISKYSRGCIIPDLSFEEAENYMPLFDKYGKSLVSLIAPTTPLDRVEKLVENSSFFIYLVAYLGVTGTSDAKEEDLSFIIEKIREYTSTPIYLGFGVTPENAREKAMSVDGVVVGSYFVKVLLDESLSNIEKIRKISNLCFEVKDSIN